MMMNPLRALIHAAVSLSDSVASYILQGLFFGAQERRSNSSYRAPS
jgi:hypothetical protein